MLIAIFAGICILIADVSLFSRRGIHHRATHPRDRHPQGARRQQCPDHHPVARNILLLVLAGSVIASLLSWYFMQEWFNGFAYRIGINPIIFILSTIIAMVVAYGTIALQSYKTAQSNPVNALRHE